MFKWNNVSTNLACTALVLLAGCAEVSLNELKEAPHVGSTYSQSLAGEYQNLADRECNAFNDPVSTAIFSKKGLKAAHGHGELVLPEDPAEWLIGKPLISEMQRDRARLMAALVPCGQQSAPKEAAAAIRYYDEWVEQAAEGWQPEDIANARRMFLENLKVVENTCAAKAAPTVVERVIVPVPKHHAQVYFKINRYDLDAEARKTLDNLKKFIDETSHVTIRGHTDASGTTRHNQILSRKRAEAVNQYLLGHKNIAEDIVEGKGVVPHSPKYERLNRRVDVKIYNTTAGLKSSNR